MFKYRICRYVYEFLDDNLEDPIIITKNGTIYGVNMSNDNLFISMNDGIHILDKSFNHKHIIDTTPFKCSY